MIRSRTLAWHVSRLALVAVLLLVLLPTIGRLAQPGQVMTGSEHMAMTSGHHDMVDGMVHSPSLHDAADAHDGHLGHGNDDVQPLPSGDADCDYCPLLIGLLTAAACVLLLLSQTLRSVSCDLRLVAVRPAFHPCGLGSRGPPLAL